MSDIEIENDAPAPSVRYRYGKTMNLVGLPGDLARAFMATVITPKVCVYADGWNDKKMLEKPREITGRDVTPAAVTSFRQKYFGSLNAELVVGKQGQRVRELERENAELRERLAKAQEKAGQVEAVMKIVGVLQAKINEEGRRLDRIETDVARAKEVANARDLRPAAVA